MSTDASESPATAEAPAPEPPAPPATLVPAIGDIEVPIHCFHCDGHYLVPARHVRTGNVLFCPHCKGSYVVNTSVYDAVHRVVREFHAALVHEFGTVTVDAAPAEAAERVAAVLPAVRDAVGAALAGIRPPGAPRKPAGIFG